MDPAKAVAPLVAVLNDDAAPTPERQRAIVTLSRLKGDAVKELDTWGGKLVAGTVPPDLQVDVWDVLKASKFEKWQQLHRKFEGKLPADPVGRFAIGRKVPGYDPSPLGVLYKPMYFYGGYAIHGNPSVPPYPASHGCIRVPHFVPDRLFESEPYGEVVIVY